MKYAPFFVILLAPVVVWAAELAPDQVKNLQEQEKAYGEIPEREIKYYKETAPQNIDKNRNFYLHDHPLQEDPSPDNTVE